MTTPQTQRFEALRQEIDDQNITGPMKNSSQVHIGLDEKPGGGVNGADLYTQEITEFRPISQTDGVAAPKDIRETWIKGNKQFDFEIRVRPICPSCTTLMGVGDLPKHLMGQCHQCLVDTCPICLNECITCGKMMCNQHSYGHGVEGGPLCPDCLYDVLVEKEWQRQLEAYNAALDKLQIETDHREVMEQIRREDERDRIEKVLDYYKHQDALDAEMIQRWRSEMLEQNRFEQELAQRERESQRDYDVKMEDRYLREQEIEKEHERGNRELDIREDENKRQHEQAMRDLDIKDKESDQKHEREMYSNETDRKEVNKKHKRKNKRIEYDHSEERNKQRIEEKEADQKHSRESDKIQKNYNIDKQEQNRKDREQKVKEEKVNRMMNLREYLIKNGYERKPLRQVDSSGTAIEVE